MTDGKKRERARETLLASEERSRALFRGIPMPSYAWKREGDNFVLADFNDAAESITRGAVARILGTTARALYADAPDILEDFERCFREKRLVKRQMPYRFRTTGEVLDFDVTYVFIPPDSVLVHTQDITERTRAEQTLRESEERHRLILSNLDEIVYVVGIENGTPLESRAQFVSEGVERITGYAAKDFLRDPGLWLRAVHPDDLSAVEQATRRILESGASGTREYRLRHGKTGAYIWIEDHVIPRLDDFGRPAAILGVARDVTERKLAEEKFRSLLDSAPDAMVIVGRNGEMLLVNAQAERLFGYTRQELLGRPVEILVPTRLREQHRKHRSAYSVDPRARPIGAGRELYGLRKDGTEFPAEISLSPLETEEGLLVSSAIRDITERKRAEEALRTSEERLRVGLNTANIAIFNQDMNLRYIWMYQPQLGYTTEQVVGRTDAELLPPEAGRQVMEIKRRVLESGLTERAEVSFNIGGQAFVYDLIAEPLRDAIGAISGLTGASLDITERKRAEEELKGSRERLLALSRRLIDAQEAERRHVARELHDEIGQALTALKINLQAAHRPGGDAEAASRFEDSMSIVEQVIQQVRDMSLALRPSLLDDLGLVAALRWCVDHQAQRSGFEAKLEAEPARIRVSPDVEIGCYRVAQEALSNVAQHAQAHNVRVEVALREGELRLLIRDDGIGFDVKAARERAGPGTRMGLFTMSERTSLLGGRLEMKSAPGQGTEIRAVFPASPAR